MKYFIKIKDGQPFEHPITEENFRKAFPELDVNNLPPTFAEFIKASEDTQHDLYEVADTVSYKFINGVVREIKNIRPVTEDEKNLINKVIEEFVQNKLNALKQIATEKINLAQNDALKNAWLNYLNELNNWVLTDYRNPVVPPLPNILPDGTILTNDLPGSVPNVVG